MNDDQKARATDRALRLAPWAVIVLVAAIFFSPFLLEGKVFLAADNLYLQFPWRSYVQPGFRSHNPLITDPVNHNYAGLYNAQLKEGDLKGWNPTLLTGLPATGATAMSGMPGRYWPLKLLLHRLLPPTTALNMLLLLHVLLMGASMFLYLGEIGAGRRGALFGAVAYMFNGCAMVWFEFEGLVASAAFVPLLLLCLERLHGRTRWPAAFAGGLTLGIIALMGHLQYLIYNCLLAGFYFLFLLGRAARAPERRRELAGMVVSFLALLGISVGVAAADLLPLAELMGLSGRIDRTFAYRDFFETLGRVPFRYYVTLLFPDFFGSPPLYLNLVPRSPRQEYMNYCELGMYMGVATLFAFVAFLAAAKDARGRFYLGMTALFAALMSGTVLYYPFFLLVPGMDRMNPTRILWIFVFCFIVSASLGLRGLDSLRGRRRAAFLAGTAALLGAFFLIAWWGRTPGGVAWFDAEASAYSRGNVQALAAQLAPLRRLSAPGISTQLLLAAGAAALFALCCLLRRRAWSLAAFGGIVALLAFDLIRYGQGFNTAVDPRLVYQPTPGIQFLQRQPGPFRVVQDAARGMGFNAFAPFGIQDIGGYSSFSLARVGNLLSAAEFGEAYFRGRRFDRWKGFGTVSSPVWDLLNVRYVLTAPGARLEAANLREVYRGEMSIFENARALPRAFVAQRHWLAGSGDEALARLLSPAFVPGAEVVLEEAPAAGFLAGVRPDSAPARVSVEEYTPDRVRIRAEAAANGWLVLTDAAYPGWRATVDGREVPVRTADYAFRAVELAAGRHEVVFEFKPRSFFWGATLSLLTGALALAGIGWAVVRGRRGAQAGGRPAA